LLAKLASSGKGGRQRTVIQETLKTPRQNGKNTARGQVRGDEEESLIVNAGNGENA